MGWNERSDPDMRTANFKFSCDVYREGVYTTIPFLVKNLIKKIYTNSLIYDNNPKVLF